MPRLHEQINPTSAPAPAEPERGVLVGFRYADGEVTHEAGTWGVEAACALLRQLDANAAVRLVRLTIEATGDVDTLELDATRP